MTSRTYNKATEIEGYFVSLLHEFGVDKQHETKPNPFSSTDVKDEAKRPRQAAEAALVPSVKTKKVSPPRATLAPNKHQFAEPADEKGKQLLREASYLKLRETPLGCAFLLRALLEFSVETEMRASGLSDKDADGKTLDLRGRFNVVSQHLTDTKGRLTQKGDLTAIKTTLNAKHGPVSFGALNGYIHDRYQKLSVDDLRNAWDSAVPLFRAIYGGHS